MLIQLAPSVKLYSLISHLSNAVVSRLNSLMSLMWAVLAQLTCKAILWLTGRAEEMTATSHISQSESDVSVGHCLMMERKRQACALYLSCDVFRPEMSPACIILSHMSESVWTQTAWIQTAHILPHMFSYFCLWRSHKTRHALLPEQHECDCPSSPLLPLSTVPHIFGAKDGHCSSRQHENRVTALPPLTTQAHVPLVGLSAH